MTTKLLTVLACILLSTTLLAQGTSCTNATLVTNGTYNGTLTGSVQDHYYFVASSGSITVSVASPTGCGVKIEIADFAMASTGTCVPIGTANAVTSNPGPSCPTGVASTTFTLTAGHYYYLRIYRNFAPSPETYSFTLSGGSPAALAVSAAATATTCPAATDGSTTATATGGSTPYNYTWSNGQTTATATGLVGGTYTVTVDDSMGATATATATVNQPMPAAITITPTDAACGNTDGSASASASGAVSPLTYVWSDGQTTPAATGLGAGNYSITVTDANGCTATETTTIASLGGPMPNALITDVTCYGGSDGELTLTVTGGTAPYTYLWQGGAPDPVLPGLQAGTYNVTITDSDGCTATPALIVGEPANPLSAATTAVEETGSCEGSITVGAVSNGASPYTYLWDNAAGSQTTETATGLCAGAYSCTVTDNNGCTLTLTDTVAVTIGIGQPSAGQILKVYPNPGTGAFWFEYDLKQSATATIEVLDAMGKLITRQPAANAAGRVLIDLSAFPAGIYYCKLAGDAQLSVRKMMKL